MKTPTDLAGARRRRAADELRETIAIARTQLHTTIDRLFDALDTYQSAALAIGDGSTPAERRIVSCAEAAAYLTISETALRSLVDRGTMPCIRIPSSRGSRPIMRFDLDDLDRHLQTLKQSA